jgi:Ca2+-transporting ATPase
VIEDRQRSQRLSIAKFSQGAPERRSIVTQNFHAWASQLNSDLHSGISSKQAEELLQKHGPNEIHKATSKPILHIVLEQINILNVMVACCGILCFLQGRFTIYGIPFGEKPDYFNGVIMFLIVGLCIIVGVYMEWSCSRVMADVGHLRSLTCMVIRDGCEIMIPLESVVPGDIVSLRVGDSIPADCIVIEAAIYRQTRSHSQESHTTYPKRLSLWI